jgi:hypothetical protein
MIITNMSFLMQSLIANRQEYKTRSETSSPTLLLKEKGDQPHKPQM